MNSMDKKSVLFVCLGNICRSTMAEGIFRSMIKTRPDYKDWKVDSCGTSDEEAGSTPDNRTLRTLRKNGVSDYSHIARQLTKNDFKNFYYILGMDLNNVRILNGLKPSDFQGVVDLFGRYDDTNKSSIISDPYYDDEKVFQKVYEMCHRACTGFLEKEGFN